MPFSKDVPYNDLSMLPPKSELDSKEILKKCIKARAAIAELKGAGELIPNQLLLIRSIGLQEARLSSEIENIVTTTDALYQALADAATSSDPASKEVLRYQEALQMGFSEVQRNKLLTTNLFCNIASTIKRQNMQIRTLTGTKIKSMTDDEIIYTPPEGEVLIRNMLSNLEHFVNTPDDIDPLIKLAIIHYQFEAIHPFTDGNGRTGRVINILYLLQQDLLKMPVLYLSRYLIEHKSKYYSLLRSVTENNDWEPWILYMLDGLESTANQTKTKIEEIRQSMLNMESQIRRELSKPPKDLVNLLYSQPYCKISFLTEQEIAGSRQTATNILRKLEGAGILQSVRSGREVYFINRTLIDLLVR